MRALSLILVLMQPQPIGREASGIVLDATRAPLAGAQVTVTCGERTWTTVADGRGRFRVAGLPAERCSIHAAQEGFVGESQPAALTTQASHTLEFRLAVRPFASQVVVTPNRGFDTDRSQVVPGTAVVGRDALASRPFTIVTQALKEEAGVLAQQTTAGQGSPILRGFTGQGNLYLLDGVRYNTAAWRDGPSQYLAWLPAADLDRIEIVRGPASAQYGSDSLGGTLGFYSVEPPSPGVRRADGSASLSLGSANQLRSIDAAVTLGQARWSASLAASAHVVDDLRAGRAADSHAAVTRFLGLPSEVVGPRLEQTGYTQTALSASARLQAGSARHLTASYRRASQDDAHRYDQEMGGNGRYRSAFGPQQLDFGLVRYESARQRWVDRLTATLSVNRQSDGRLDQARPTARIDEQVNTTTAMGYGVQGTRSFSSRLAASFGAEVYDEYISGHRTLTEPDGSVTAARPDIPDGTRYTSAGAFWQQGVVVVAGRLHARGGLRYGHFGFSSAEDASLGVPGESASTGDTSFNAGVVATITKTWTATASVSRGFRAANAFDLGAIGLSGGGGFEISPRRAADLGGLRGSTDGATAVTTGQPVGALGPEVVMAYEASLRWQLPRASLMVTLFDLEYEDAIARRTLIVADPVVGQSISGFTIVRQDAAGRVYVAEDTRPVTTRVNVSRARISGFEAEASARVTSAVRARAWASSARGTELDTNSPRRRMPPLMGGVSLTWQRPGGRGWIEGTVIAAADQDRLSDGDLGDARIGATRTPASVAGFFNGTAADRGLVQGGRLVATGETVAQVQARVLGGAAILPLFTKTSGFASLSFRAGLPLGAHVDLIVIGENLTDRNYRLHGSGVDEPGLGAHARLRVRF